MRRKRPERLADLLLEFVSQLLGRGVNDPRIRAVTLTRCEISGDLRYARLYFSVLSGREAKGEVLEGLKSAAGFIRSRIAKEFRLRFVPSIEFTYDDSQDKAQRIEQLLRMAKGSEK